MVWFYGTPGIIAIIVYFPTATTTYCGVVETVYCYDFNMYTYNTTVVVLIVVSCVVLPTVVAGML